MAKVKRVDVCFAISLALTAALALCSLDTDEENRVKAQETQREQTSASAFVPAEMVKTEKVELPETNPPVALYNAPLAEDLQCFIIEQAEANGIDPAIIFAMAYRESTYKTNCIGDGGNSYGLLQVQPRWHYKRMQKLGCTDLLDPFQNVAVGIDYLAEQLDRYDGDIAKALTAYNRGHYAGTVTQYARDVLAKAEELAASTYIKDVKE